MKFYAIVPATAGYAEPVGAATGLLAYQDGVLLALFAGIGKWTRAGKTGHQIYVGDDTAASVPITEAGASTILKRLAPGVALPT